MSTDPLNKTSQAAGFIETIGYLAAIEAADTSTKSANVELAGLEIVGSGLVTIVVRGDISAVKAAVDAGAAAASKVGTVVSFHVIGRPAFSIDDLLFSSENSTDSKLEDNDRALAHLSKTDEKVTNIKEFGSEKPDTTPPINPTETVASEVSINPETETPEQSTRSSEQLVNAELLQSYRTVELRNKARQLSGFEMSKRQIKFAKKEELIKAIVAWYQVTK